MSRLVRTSLTAISAAFLVTLGGTQTRAQNAIVQPLPPAEAGDLNEALRRLARNPVDLDALLAAGEASIALEDSDAAMGFFARAQDLAPAHPRVKLGLARAFLAEGRPIEALRFFAEAQGAGAPLAAMAADRALAFDLVGDNASAAELYRLALRSHDTPSVRYRMALNQAVSGDKAGFEATLLPLLQDNDRTAFRTRAFGLAILGEADEAISIAEALMPTDLALRMAPYLRYMGRLTKAQQAAAANLGVFPRAGDIGRDRAAIADYSDRGAAIARNADSALTPSGPPMGNDRTARRGQRTQTAPQQARPSRRRPDRETAPPGNRRRSAPDLLSRSRVPAIVPQADPGAGRAEESAPAPVATPAPAQAPREVPAAVVVADRPVEGPEMDSDAASARSATSPAQETLVPASNETPAEPVRVASLDDAFADFGTAPDSAVAPSSGAVDITAIEIPREKAEPEPPKHPARHWVQVATGRDRAALKFDWRRIARKAEGLLDGKGPFVTPWVEANRLLAGPYESEAAAREMVNKLKGIGIDSFPFSSPEGEAIETLD